MKKLILTLLLMAAVAGSAGAYYNLTRPGEVTRVSYLAVTQGDVVDAVGATGALQTVRAVVVGSRVSGRIRAIYVDFNDIVRQGQILAELDPSLFETQIAQAEANLARSRADRDRILITLEDARTRLGRMRSLVERQTAAQQDLDSAASAVHAAEASLKAAEASIVQAQASLTQAEVNLAHTVIRAPSDGIVVSRDVDVGQTVAASMNAPTLFVIADDLSRLQVIANIDESDLGRLRAGQVARFRVDAHPGEEFTGEVSQIRLTPIVKQNVVSYAAVIDVPNPELRLMPGMTAAVTIEIAARTNVVRVPNGALRYRPGADIFAELGLPVPPELRRSAGGGSGETRGRAWVYTGGQLRSVDVRLGISDGTWTELLSNELQAGQELVSNIVTPAMAAAAASRTGGRSTPGEQGHSSNPLQGGGGHGGGH